MLLALGYIYRNSVPAQATDIQNELAGRCKQLGNIFFMSNILFIFLPWKWEAEEEKWNWQTSDDRWSAEVLNL